MKESSLLEERLEKIKRKITKRGGILEIDFFYASIPVRDKEKLYFPYEFMVIEHHSYFIFDCEITRQPEEAFLKFPNRFLDLLEKWNFLPDEIWVKKEEVFRILEPIALKLGVKLSRVKRLKAMENAKGSMTRFFRQRSSE